MPFRKEQMYYFVWYILLWVFFYFFFPPVIDPGLGMLTVLPIQLILISALAVLVVVLTFQYGAAIY